MGSAGNATGPPRTQGSGAMWGYQADFISQSRIQVGDSVCTTYSGKGEVGHSKNSEAQNIECLKYFLTHSHSSSIKNVGEGALPPKSVARLIFLAALENGL